MIPPSQHHLARSTYSQSFYHGNSVTQTTSAGEFAGEWKSADLNKGRKGTDDVVCASGQIFASFRQLIPFLAS
jgi:hypothetical protein